MSGPRLTNREQGHLIRLRERCEVLRARLKSSPHRAHYVIDWERDLKATEWAIAKIEDTAQGASELQSAAASNKEPTE